MHRINDNDGLRAPTTFWLRKWQISIARANDEDVCCVECGPWRVAHAHRMRGACGEEIVFVV